MGGGAFHHKKGIILVKAIILKLNKNKKQKSLNFKNLSKILDSNILFSKYKEHMHNIRPIYNSTLAVLKSRGVDSISKFFCGEDKGPTLGAAPPNTLGGGGQPPAPPLFQRPYVQTQKHPGLGSSGYSSLGRLGSRFGSD